MELVALHNEGLIDVIEAFASLKNDPSKGSAFFRTRSVFEKALPDLDAPVLSTMHCVLRLFRNAGKDFAAGMIIESFIGFCSKDISRPREALAQIEKNPDAFADLLVATLVAGSHLDNPFYLAQAIRLCGDSNIELRRHAVFSIGRLDWPDGATVPDSALAALEHSAAMETDDQVLANVVRSVFALFKLDKTRELRAVALIASALSKGDDYTCHAASELFHFHTGALPASLLDTLSGPLVRVKTTNRGTLDNIDWGISHLLKESFSEKGIQILQNLLLAHPNELTMKIFDVTAGEIVRNRALLSKVLTRWFLRGDRALCDGVHTIVCAHHGDDLQLEIDPAELKPADPIHIIFIARKAIGYLFTRPICAVTILISLMRHTTDDGVLGELCALLFDPLLLNFTGKAREYVMQQSKIESGKVKDAIDKALKTVDDYLDNLRSTGNLAALHPGEAQREAHHRHYSRLMAESFKAAEAGSVLMHLISKTVLLYGRKSISYVYGPNGQSQRMEIPLQRHGIQMEFPRMENIDPFGLDYMIRTFRCERLRV